MRVLSEIKGPFVGGLGFILKGFTLKGLRPQKQFLIIYWGTGDPVGYSNIVRPASGVQSTSTLFTALALTGFNTT